jgi:periplasmic copper chaperone A
MQISTAIQIIATSAALALAPSAFSHIVLEQGSAQAGSSYRAVLRVGHGCGSEATQAIRVLLPAGFRGAKPMPKPGWTLATRNEKLAQPYSSHGKEVTQDVVEISWTAATPANALPDAHYDEFILRGTLPEQPGALWFKVLQRCATAQNDWAEVPATGTETKGMKTPAALLTVTPASAERPHH